MRFSENRVIAWVVLAVCVLGSVYMGSGSIAAERREVQQVFLEGAEDRDAAHCMSVYVQNAFDSARLMAKEVQLHLGSDHELAAEVLALTDSYDPSEDEGFFESGGRIKMLSQYVDDLYNDMYASGLTDAQRRDFKIAYDDYQGARRFMQKDPYLELAKDFNALREQSFLSDIACKIRGVDRLCTLFY